MYIYSLKKFFIYDLKLDIGKKDLLFKKLK